MYKLDDACDKIKYIINRIEVNLWQHFKVI